MPPDWPTPWLTHLLLENNWAAPLALLAAAACVFIYGARRDSPKTQKWAIGPAALAAVVAVLAAVVDTGREQMRANTLRLAQAARDPFDLDAMLAMMTDDVRLLHMDRERLIRFMRHVSQRFTIRDYFYTELLAHQTGETGWTYIAIWTDLESRRYGGNVLSQWLLRWRRQEDGRWKLEAVEDLLINRRDGQPILERYG